MYFFVKFFYCENLYLKCSLLFSFLNYRAQVDLLIIMYYGMTINLTLMNCNVLRINYVIRMLDVHDRFQFQHLHIMHIW